MTNLQKCPFCGDLELQASDQPVSGTHVYSVRYECGSMGNFAFGYDYSKMSSHELQLCFDENYPCNGLGAKFTKEDFEKKRKLSP